MPDEVPPQAHSVFICGPISRALAAHGFDPILRALLTTVDQHLRDGGLAVLSAHKLEQWGADIPESSGYVLRRDWALAQAADAMVFVLPADASGDLYRTDGTFIELGWALALDKPFVLITDPDATGRSYMFDGVLQQLGACATVNCADAAALANISHVVSALLTKRARAGLNDAHATRVGFCCTTFGFGPVSKATAIADAVRRLRPRYDLVFAGNDIALSFARSSGVFDEVIEIDADRSPALAAAALGDADVIVNALNFAMLGAELEVPQHFIDSLAWMWPTIPEQTARAAIYHVQDYLLSSERRAALPPNARLVPPIVSAAFATPRRSWEIEPGHALIHLGGCRNPFLPANAYAEYVQNMIDGLSLALDDPRVAKRLRSATICGNPELLAAASDGSNPRVSARFLPRQELAHEMRRADLLITSPGLTGTLEAMGLGVPCAFLLPHNFSQLRIESAYRDAGLQHLLWPDPLQIATSDMSMMPEEDGIRAVADSLGERLRCGPVRTAEGFATLLGGSDSWGAHRSPLAPLAWDGSTRVAEAVIRGIEDNREGNGHPSDLLGS